MARLTTIQIDEELIARAQRALRAKTARETVELALRRALEAEESKPEGRATLQHEYLEELPERIDFDVLRSDEMWR